MMLSSQEIDVGPLFTEALFDDDKIPTATFSFAMYGYTDEESSIVDFGEPDEDRVLDGAINSSTTVTLGFNDDFFWSTSMQAMAFGGNRSYALDGAPYTIFDTGTSHMMVPQSLF